MKKETKDELPVTDKDKWDNSRHNSFDRNLLDMVTVGIFILDADFKVAWINHAIEKYFGIKRENVIGKDKRQLIKKEIKNIFENPEDFTSKVFTTYDDNTYIENFECHVLADGKREERWLEHWSWPIKSGVYKGGRIEHYYDITKRKKIEKKLKSSQETYRTVFENTGTATIIIEGDMTVSLANSQAVSLAGYTKEDIENKMKWTDIVLPEDLERMKKYHQGRREKGKTSPAEYEFRLKDREGHIKDIFLKIGLIPNTKKTVASLTDITHRKQIAESLKQSEELLKRTERISKIGGWEFDIREKKITWTDEVYRIYGVNKKYYNPNDVRQNISFYAPKDQKKIEQALQDAIEKGKPYDLELQFISAKGQHRWVRTTGKPLKEDKKVTKVVGNLLDITKKKRSEEKIMHLNQLLLAIRNVNQLIIKEEDRNKLIQKACNILVKTRGYDNAWIVLLDKDQNYLTSAEAGLDQAFLPLKKLIQNDQYPRCARKALDQKKIVMTKNTTEECQNCPLLAYHKNRSSYTACLQQDNIVYGILSVCIPTTYLQDKEERDLFREFAGDISFALYTIETEKIRKIAQQQLEQSEKEKSIILNSSPTLIAYQNMKHEVIRANEIACRSVNKTLNELVGRKCYQIWAKREIPCEGCPVEKSWQTGKVERQERQTPDGRFWLVTGMPVTNSQGEIIGAVETTLDITERRKAEDELRQSETQYRQLVDTLNEGIWKIDKEGYTNFVNPKMVQMLGYKAKEIKGKHLFDFMDEKELPYARECLSRRSQGLSEQHEFTFRKKNGELLYTLVNISPIYAEQGPYIGAIAGIIDISLRKQAEARVRKSLDGTIQTLSKVSETRDPYTAGHQYRVHQLSVAIARELGLPREKIEAVRIAALIHDIGKMAIPSEILTKPGKLSDIEFDLIREHPQTGYEILKDIDFPYPIAQIVLQHHERINGSGYPDHLKGDEILLEAKIIGVADVVEAMSSHRPYREALGIDAALEEITKNKGILYDPEVVDVCIKLFKEKGFKFK